jgi:hypothetical protein
LQTPRWRPGYGRLVGFHSAASDLVPSDTNGSDDVFVRDRLTASTSRTSVDAGGGQSNGNSLGIDVSADGRYVAFVSGASDLVGSDANAEFDVFVRALVIPQIVSIAPSAAARGSNTTMTLTGSGFLPGARAQWGPAASGVTVNTVTVVSEEQAQLAITVAADAAPGPRDLLFWSDGTGPGALATGYAFCGACLGVT